MEASNLAIFDAVSEVNEELAVLSDVLNIEGTWSINIESDGEDVVVFSPLCDEVIFDSDLDMDDQLTKNQIKDILMEKIRTEFLRAKKFINEFLKQNP